jgi:hypothetical protein
MINCDTGFYNEYDKERFKEIIFFQNRQLLGMMKMLFLSGIAIGIVVGGIIGASL